MQSASHRSSPNAYEIAAARLAHQGDVNPRECKCERTEIRRKNTAAGPRFKRQCLDCGSATGDWLKHRDVEQIVGLLERVPAWDESAEDRGRGYFSRLSEERETVLAEEKAEWWEWYNWYLGTPEWREKADAVLGRAGGLCEGCRKNRALQVHHLTYEHVGAEFLFELVAICRPCHSRLHEMDRCR